MTGIIGKKVGMTRVFTPSGNTRPVTVIKCEQNEVIQLKTMEKDGYEAIVVGFKKLAKPTKTKKFEKVKEFRVKKETLDTVKVGDQLTIELFEAEELVKVTSVSKGKGFQGTIKRWNFSRGPESHGSHHHREPGSIGTRAKPGRVHKGKKLAGRMGGEVTTLNRIKVVLLDKENNLVCLNGPVPGPNGSTVIISKY